MRFYVNENCIGCGLCTTTCPEVFTMGDDGAAEAQRTDVAPELEKLCTECMENCPAEAIEAL